MLRFFSCFRFNSPSGHWFRAFRWDTMGVSLSWTSSAFEGLWRRFSSPRLHKELGDRDGQRARNSIEQVDRRIRLSGFKAP